MHQAKNSNKRFNEWSDKKKAKQVITGKLFTQTAIHISKKNKEFVIRSVSNYTKHSQYHEAI